MLGCWSLDAPPSARSASNSCRRSIAWRRFAGSGWPFRSRSARPVRPRAVPILSLKACLVDCIERLPTVSYRYVLWGADRRRSRRPGREHLGDVADATAAPRRVSLPAMLRRHLDRASSVSGRRGEISAPVRLDHLVVIAGYLMQKVPPKPRISRRRAARRAHPATDLSQLARLLLTPSSRRPKIRLLCFSLSGSSLSPSNIALRPCPSHDVADEREPASSPLREVL